MHIERYGTDEVAGIEIGTVFIFPKVDGTNGSVFLDDTGFMRACSRNRILKDDADNHNFYKSMQKQENIKLQKSLLRHFSLH